MEEESNRKKKRESSRLHKSDIVRVKVIEIMKETGLWSEELEEEIPRKWNEFDNYVVVNSRFFRDARWRTIGPGFWELVSKSAFGGKSLALAGRIKQDGFRSPDATILFGPSPWVEFRDNGVTYSWHVERTMFCAGNRPERWRVGGLPCVAETVVDMFAGIGYFTLPYLLIARADRVIACEWNPASVEALRRNLERNGVAGKCNLHAGDVRLVCPRRIAHRVNLGLIPSCEEYWPAAAEILLAEGGMLHVHGNVSSFPRAFVSRCDLCSALFSRLGGQRERVDFSVECANNVCSIQAHSHDGVVRRNKVEWYMWTLHASHSFCQLLSDLHGCRWAVRPVFLHRVKSYAPHIDHLVVDLSCVNLSIETDRTSRHLC